VARQQVRRRADGKARHGAQQEHHPRPLRHAGRQRRRRTGVMARQALQAK
jgi:hypothetical protein